MKAAIKASILPVALNWKKIIAHLPPLKLVVIHCCNMDYLKLLSASCCLFVINYYLFVWLLKIGSTYVGKPFYFIQRLAVSRVNDTSAAIRRPSKYSNLFYLKIYFILWHFLKRTAFNRRVNVIVLFIPFFSPSF